MSFNALPGVETVLPAFHIFLIIILVSDVGGGGGGEIKTTFNDVNYKTLRRVSFLFKLLN